MKLEPIRLSLLRQHDALRHLVDRALRAAAEVEKGVESAGERLEAATRVIAGQFLEHVALEEKVLSPILPTVDGWGPQRAEQLKKDHVAQRRMMSELLDALAHGCDPHALALTVRKLADDLLADMAEEERVILSPSVLRDDVVAIDQSAG